MYYVYKILCLKNNKVYVGRTCNFNRRVREHKCCLKHNRHSNKYLQSDYNKYGLDCFEFIILEECNLKSNSVIQETYWMNYYGGKDSDLIYNECDMLGHNEIYKYNQAKTQTRST